MKVLEAVGKTIDEAIASGLEQLGMSLGDVEVEVLEEGSKGLFGIGAKQAKVRLTEKDSPALRAEQFLTTVAGYMGMDIQVNIEDDGDHMHIDMIGDGQGTLIGYRGEVLDALQYLTSLQVNRNQDQFRRVTLDTENYREKREQTLINLAHRMAQKCSRTGRRVLLEPMNPYERRILHCALQDDPDVTTHSEGDEPNRRVVILPR